MTENATTGAAEAPAPDALEAKVARLEKQVAYLTRKRVDMRDNWKKFAVGHLGDEADDGRIS